MCFFFAFCVLLFFCIFSILLNFFGFTSESEIPPIALKLRILSYFDLLIINMIVKIGANDLFKVKTQKTLFFMFFKLLGNFCVCLNSGFVRSFGLFGFFRGFGLFIFLSIWFIAKSFASFRWLPVFTERAKLTRLANFVCFGLSYNFCRKHFSFRTNEVLAKCTSWSISSFFSKNMSRNILL